MRESFYILLAIMLFGCVEDPVPPDSDSSLPAGKNAAYILCEGLWYMDNSSLVRYDFLDGSVTPNYFARANPGQTLGDIANHIVLKGDTAYVAITTAKLIQVFRASDGETLGRISIPGNAAPRRICIVNDTLGFVTDLYQHKIWGFNPRTLKLNGTEIATGPAPEGICHYGGKLFVANSGAGDILVKKPKAGTVSVISLSSLSETALLEGCPNVIDVKIHESHNSLFVRYNDLPSKDTLGGIAEYSLTDFQLIRNVRIKINDFLIHKSKDVIFINDDGVHRLDAISGRISTILDNPNPKEHWYSLTISPSERLWLGNARNYQSEGEIQIYTLPDFSDAAARAEYLYSFPAGLNPNTIVFF